MSQRNNGHPIAWLAPDASVRLQRSPSLEENVMVVDGDMTFDMRVGEFAIVCEGYGDDEKYIDIEIYSLANSRDNMVLCLSAVNLEQLFNAINDFRPRVQESGEDVSV